MNLKPTKKFSEMSNVSYFNPNDNTVDKSKKDSNVMPRVGYFESPEDEFVQKVKALEI